MTSRTVSKVCTCRLALALLVPLGFASGCKPSEEAPQESAPDVMGHQVPEGDVCKNVVRVLATSILTREKGKPKETDIPFEVDPETTPLEGGLVPICVSVTSLEAKPRVLASGRFTLDGEELLGPSAFNQNTSTAKATKDVGSGSHTLTARIASAPGTRVRVYVYLGSRKPPFADNPVSSGAIVMPDKETIISVGAARITFPAGAVDAPVPVTVSETYEPYGLSNRIQFLPDGLHFNKPAMLEISYDLLRLPDSVKEAELIAQDAIRIMHDVDWRPTSIDSATHRATAPIEHFSGAYVGETVLIDHPIPGGVLARDDNSHVFVAKFPLGTMGLQLSVQASRITVDPNTNEPLPAKENPYFKLTPLAKLVENVPGNKLSINLSPWKALKEPFVGWCDKALSADCGCPKAEGIGIGWLNVTVRDTINHDVNYKYKGSEYLFLIGMPKAGGLFAAPYEDASAAHDQLDQWEKNGGHGVLVGSETSIQRDTHPGKHPLGCTEPKDDMHSALAIGVDDKTLKPILMLISSTSEAKTGGKLCDILKRYQVKDAILLDGGKSAGMIQNHTPLNPLFSKDYENWLPARNIQNAFSISNNLAPDSPVIKAPACAVARQNTAVSVTFGADPNGQEVKVRCGSDGSNYGGVNFYETSLSKLGGTVFPVFNWSAPGSKSIYCTTFDKSGNASSAAVATVHVGEVTKVFPDKATLGKETEFTIEGTNLCNSTVAWIPDCVGNPPGKTLQTYEEGGLRRFTCTPAGALGTRMDSVVKTNASGHVYAEDFPIEFVQ